MVASIQRAGARTVTQVLWVTSLGLPGSFQLPSPTLHLTRRISYLNLTCLPFPFCVMDLSEGQIRLKHSLPLVLVRPTPTMLLSLWLPGDRHSLPTLTFVHSVPCLLALFPALLCLLLLCWFQRCSVKLPWPAGLRVGCPSCVLAATLNCLSCSAGEDSGALLPLPYLAQIQTHNRCINTCHADHCVHPPRASKCLSTRLRTASSGTL